MPSNKVMNMERMFTYTEWNQEMIDLYNKYSLVRELNQELMKNCPVYAMYTISEYLKRKRIDMEIELSEYSKKVFALASNNPQELVKANEIVERKTFLALKPIVEDYIKARTYYVCAMQKSEDEYIEFINSREKQVASVK